MFAREEPGNQTHKDMRDETDLELNITFTHNTFVVSLRFNVTSIRSDHLPLFVEPKHRAGMKTKQHKMQQQRNREEFAMTYVHVSPLRMAADSQHRQLGPSTMPLSSVINIVTAQYRRLSTTGGRQKPLSPALLTGVCTGHSPGRKGGRAMKLCGGGAGWGLGCGVCVCVCVCARVRACVHACVCVIFVCVKATMSNYSVMMMSVDADEEIFHTNASSQPLLIHKIMLSEGKTREK